MFPRKGRWAAIVLVAGVAGVAVVPVSTASAATITACVKSKTGELRISSGGTAKKKCAKGWKRVRWGTNGAVGKQGIPGFPGIPGIPGQQGVTAPAFSVKDANGAVVGSFVGVYFAGYYLHFVLRDGGVYPYLPSGEVFPGLSAPASFKTPDCSGTAFLKYNSGGGFPTLGQYVKLFGGSYRIAFRTVSVSGAFGPTLAWKGRGTSENVAVPIQMHRRNSTTGACELDGAPYTGDLVLFDEVPAPPDFVGPLTVG